MILEIIGISLFAITLISSPFIIFAGVMSTDSGNTNYMYPIFGLIPTGLLVSGLLVFL
jgi:hypothetical protein